MTCGSGGEPHIVDGAQQPVGTCNTPLRLGRGGDLHRRLRRTGLALRDLLPHQDLKVGSRVAKEYQQPPALLFYIDSREVGLNEYPS